MTWRIEKKKTGKKEYRVWKVLGFYLFICFFLFLKRMREEGKLFIVMA